jgi:glycosyltransferase involved in cell wall biosynthesis
MTSISVVIPCYNAEAFLQETIASVLSQTYDHYEIILVDDGSTDGTASVIQSYGTQVRAVFTPNRGASAARNLGTSLAQGEFIQYLDADDLLAPEALAARVAALLSTNGDVAYCGWQKLDQSRNGQFTPTDVTDRPIEAVHPDPEIALFTDFWCPPAALLYSRSIVDKIGRWNESLPIIQDARFLLDAALLGGRFTYVPGVSAYYRVHGSQSLSRKNQHAFVKDCFENACQVEEFWQSHGGMSSDRQQALLRVYGQSARFFFEYDRQFFYEILNKIHRLEPQYLPEGPKILRFLSRWLGYPRGEEISLLYRIYKRKLPNL